MLKTVERTLTPDQLIERLKTNHGVTKNKKTLSMWRYEGKGPVYIKPFGRILYKLEDIINWERQIFRH